MRLARMIAMAEQVSAKRVLGRGAVHNELECIMELSPVANLKFLHTDSTLSGAKLEQFRRLSTGELKSSLAPGQPGSLMVRPDGTFWMAITESACLPSVGKTSISFPER